VWHAGNFNPATKANLTGANFSGGVELTYGDPSLWFHHPQVKRARWVVDSGGNLLWQDQGGQAHFYVTPGGAVWTQQLGDLNSRIEQRGADYMNAAIANANNYAASLHNAQEGSINERVHRIRLAGASNQTAGYQVTDAPSVVVDCWIDPNNATFFRRIRTLQMHVNSLGGWANVWGD
jgi:hypothetical protein